MNKRIFIIHGWDGFPEEGWFPWLNKAMEGVSELKVSIAVEVGVGKNWGEAK